MCMCVCVCVCVSVCIEPGNTAAPRSEQSDPEAVVGLEAGRDRTSSFYIKAALATQYLQPGHQVFVHVPLASSPPCISHISRTLAGCVRSCTKKRSRCPLIRSKVAGCEKKKKSRALKVRFSRRWHRRPCAEARRRASSSPPRIDTLVFF